MTWPAIASSLSARVGSRLHSLLGREAGVIQLRIEKTGFGGSKLTLGTCQVDGRAGSFAANSVVETVRNTLSFQPSPYEGTVLIVATFDGGTKVLARQRVKVE